MPITKSPDGSLEYTEKRDNWNFNETGVIAGGQLSISGDSDVLKQMHFSTENQATNTDIVVPSVNLASAINLFLYYNFT